jgi:hypothetical protein
MGQLLTQELPDTPVLPPASLLSPQAGYRGVSPRKTGGIAPPNSGVITMGTRSPSSYGEHTMVVSAWRPGAPRVSSRQRVASWRARNWRRAVLAWFVVTLAIMAMAAEPSTDFPRAQANSVPAVRVTLEAAEMLTMVGVPLLLIALPLGLRDG